MLTYADVCEFAKGVRRAAAALGEFALGLAERAWGSPPVESAPPPLAGEFAPSLAGESAPPARGGEGVQLLAGESSSLQRETLKRWPPAPPPLAGGANSRELAAGEREEREALLAFALSVVELLFYHCRWSCGGGHVEGEKKKTKKLQAASDAVEEEEEEEEAAAAAARCLVERLSAAAHTIGTQFTCFTSVLLVQKYKY
jgi:hypothetical protein